MAAPPYNNRLKREWVGESESGQPMDRPNELVVLKDVTMAYNGAAVELVSDARVGPGRTAILTGFVVLVNGATAWASGTSLRIEDTAGNAVATVLTAALTGNATIHLPAMTVVDRGVVAAPGRGLKLATVGTFSAGSTAKILAVIHIV